MTSQASYTITAVKDGNDLDSILVLWKKTSTNAAPAKPSGTNLNGWTEDMPEFESGAYVWTCNRVAISDPTAATPIYTYTDPVLDTHWKKLDEVYKQGTEIKNTVDNISLKYSNSNGEETSFKLTNGSIDITLLKNQVDAAATTATNFISMRGDGGIEVGNKSGGNWTGYRTQMLASEFNILTAAGKKVASYGASEIGFFDSNAAQIASFKPDMIRLGMSGTTDTAIDFNNGMLTLSYDADRDRTMMRANRMYIYSDTGYEISIGSSQKDANNDVIGGQVFCNDNGTYLRGYSGDTYSVDLYSEMYLRFDGRGLWESVGTDNEGYIQRSYIEMWPHKLLIRGQSSGGLWDRGRDNALLASTSGTGTSAYFPVIDAKCNTGDWSIGTLGDYLYFVFTRDTNYSAGANTTSKIAFNPDGHLILPQYATYQNTFADGSEVVIAEPYYEGGSGYKALIYGKGNGANIDTIVRGKDVEMRADASMRIYPYYGGENNPNYWSLMIGVVNTSIGPCLRPFQNGYCSIGANQIGFKYIYATNTGIQSTSDARLKENISYDFSKLERLFGMLRPVTYEYKHLADDDDIRIGFIAQDVWSALETCGYDPRRFAAIHTEEVDPESDLKEYIDTDETYYLNYTEFTALNTYMIQKMMKRIEELEKRIA